jgi:hypothetical protein
MADPMTSRPSTAAPILATTVVVVLVLLLLAYVSAYFIVRREARVSPTGMGYVMKFDTRAQAMFFWPAMRVQGFVTGYGIFYMTSHGSGDCVCQDRS